MDYTYPADTLGPLVVYLLVRTDMESMNPGKGHAQSHHAGTQMVLRDMPKWSDAHKVWLEEWSKEADGFGTVLCLGATGAQMERALERAVHFDLPSGIVHDPTYPLKDGDTLHLLPVETCAYIFGPKVFVESLVTELGLHP